jgi:hypothetical protein
MEQSPRGPRDEDGKDSGGHLVNSMDIAIEFGAQPDFCVQHYIGDSEVT